MNEERKRKAKGSIIVQVMLMFLACVIIIGFITYYSQYRRSQEFVRSETEKRASRIATEVTMAVKEYPAYRWLIRYWHNHYKELDIEYDVVYGYGSETEKKSKLLQQHHPEIQQKYATVEDILTMSEEDKKLYAEITYSWLITHVNEIKRVHNITFLFCVLTNEPYEEQFFILSAADRGAVRGTEYEQVYPLGKISTVDEIQQAGMVAAVEGKPKIVPAGKYVDYYSLVDVVNEEYLLVGMTYDHGGILSDISQRTALGSLMAMAYQMLLLTICSIGIYFLVLKPLKEVQANIRTYKKDKNSEEVENNLKYITLDNEIGELSTDIIELTHEIDNYLEEIQTITSEKERIGAELSLANRIQASMLPHIFPPFPERTEFDIFASMDPAREVGGDFYDFYLIDEDHLCLVMADVSGKGIPAALFMMISKTIIQSVAMLGGSPAEILTKANEALCSNNQTEMFVTVWIGILEISTGKLTAANAGHEYPVIKKKDGDYELYKDKHGFIIGGMNDMVYTQYELDIEPGDKLFLYTDGVPEATDAGKAMFGTERMLEALNDAKDATVEETLATVRKHVDDFVKDAEQFDDLTMMCVEYMG